MIGIGLSVEMFNQQEVWPALQKHSEGSILPMDTDAYPTTANEKNAVAEKRAVDTLKSALSQFVEQWPIPSVSVWAYSKNPESPSGDSDHDGVYNYFGDRINDLRILGGMHRHSVFSIGAYFQNEPEDVLERSFKFFDGYPEVPALLLMVADGDQIRSRLGDVRRAAYWKDGKRRFGSMAESFVALLLARRERVDGMRQFAGKGVAPQHVARHIAAGFAPSKYLPEPWTKSQIQQFDMLPTIARLHRPIRVAYRKDSEGKPTFDSANGAHQMHALERQEAFKVGFDAALKSTREGKPAKLFFDFGAASNGRSSIPLAQAISSSLPELDMFNYAQSNDIGTRLGDTGAASPFVQWALASISARDNKNESIAVNLRQSDEATITVITPVMDAIQSNRAIAAVSKSSEIVVAPALVRAVPIGACMNSGDECPQGGMWKCDPHDIDAGGTHYIHSGRTFPMVKVAHTLSAWEKLRGDLPFQKAEAKWTLTSYDAPSDLALHTGRA